MFNQPNQPNLLTQFQSHLVAQSKSPNTILAYTKDLNSYFSHINQSPTTLTRDSILSYKSYLQHTKSTNAKTINRILSSLKSYNEYLISKTFSLI